MPISKTQTVNSALIDDKHLPELIRIVQGWVATKYIRTSFNEEQQATVYSLRDACLNILSASISGRTTVTAVKKIVGWQLPSYERPKTLEDAIAELTAKPGRIYIPQVFWMVSAPTQQLRQPAGVGVDFTTLLECIWALGDCKRERNCIIINGEDSMRRVREADDHIKKMLRQQQSA